MEHITTLLTAFAALGPRSITITPSAVCIFVSTDDSIRDMGTELGTVPATRARGASSWLSIEHRVDGVIVFVTGPERFQTQEAA